MTDNTRFLNRPDTLDAIPATPIDYDAIIIGSGQAGNPLAHKLADNGWTVALIERDHLGGSCINYGCTPTKTMLASARLAHYARKAAAMGVNTGEISIDLEAVVARKNKIVQEWRGGQEYHADSRPTLDVYRGEGSFLGPRTVIVNDTILNSDHIFINTGARPRIPALPGLDTTPYLTNRNILDLTELPDHLLVLGGSYIGLEFGQMFRRFGSRVTIIEAGDQLVGREDADVAQALQEALEQEGIRVLLQSEAVHVSGDEGAIRLTVRNNDGDREEFTGSHLLIAVGRTPNTEKLNLAAAGVAVSAGGHIPVTDHLVTNVPGIWALGDVKGGPAFTHVSYDDHLIVYDNLLNGGRRVASGRTVPYALFTDPELGRVGLTEKDARAAGYRLKIGKIPMSWVARAIERGETAGLMKIVIDADTDLILGATVLGSEGGELVQTLMALMMAGAPWTLFHRAMFIHPTMTEGFFTLMDNVTVDEPALVPEAAALSPA